MNRCQKSVGLLDGLTIQPSKEMRIGRCREQLGDLGVGDPVVVEEESLGEGLIPLAA